MVNERRQHTQKNIILRAVYTNKNTFIYFYSGFDNLSLKYILGLSSSFLLKAANHHLPEPYPFNWSLHFHLCPLQPNCHRAVHQSFYNKSRYTMSLHKFLHGIFLTLIKKSHPHPAGGSPAYPSNLLSSTLPPLYMLT